MDQPRFSHSYTPYPVIERSLTNDEVATLNDVINLIMHQNRLQTIAIWFSQMNEALQTLTLVSLFRKTTPKIAKFLIMFLEAALNEEANSKDLEICEREANNAVFISDFKYEQEEVAISKLLSNLPLLRPSNIDAKNEYIKISKLLLTRAIQNGSCLDEAKQIMAFIILHPALKTEKKSFEVLNRALAEKVQKEAIISASATISTRRFQRSNSLTPPYSSPAELFTDDLYIRKARSSSISLYGGPLSPQSSGTTSSGSGSESHLDETILVSDNAIANDKVLRNDVEAWLKYLRLHKYTNVFLRMSYEQLISINDSNFEKILNSLGHQRITEGARRKIILHIGKLGERVTTLKKKDEEVSSGESLVLKAALDELKAIINTPIRSFMVHPRMCEADIPSLFCSVLNKVCTYTLTSSNNSVQAMLCEQLIPLLDTVLEKPAFFYQKKQIMEWKSQITQLNARVQSKHFLHAPQRPKIHRNSLTLSPPLNVETLQLPKKHSLQDHSLYLMTQQRSPSAPPPSLDKQLENLAITVAEKPLSTE